MKPGTRIVVNTPHAWGAKQQRATVMYPRGADFLPPRSYLLVRFDGDRESVCVPRTQIEVRS